MDKFGRSFETMTDNYDPTTGVITREKSKLKVIDFKYYTVYMPTSYVFKMCFSHYGCGGISAL